jgi:hypothetical protein
MSLIGRNRTLLKRRRLRSPQLTSDSVEDCRYGRFLFQDLPVSAVTDPWAWTVGLSRGPPRGRILTSRVG